MWLRGTTTAPTTWTNQGLISYRVAEDCAIDYDDLVACKYVLQGPVITVSGVEETIELDVSNSPSSYNFGVVVESSTYATGISYFTVTNNSSCAVEIAVSAGNMTGGIQWIISDTCTPDTTHYGLKAGNTTDYDTIVKGTAPFNTLVSDLPSSQEWDFGFKLYTPTVHSDGALKTAIVTLIASLAT